jgi:hypothetical protein
LSRFHHSRSLNSAVSGVEKQNSQTNEIFSRKKKEWKNNVFCTSRINEEEGGTGLIASDNGRQIRE